MMTQEENKLWDENTKELSALIDELRTKLLEQKVCDPKIGFILNWSRGSGAYSLRLCKKRQIKEKVSKLTKEQMQQKKIEAMP